MKLLVGLGNIGDSYTDTRHNAGFMFLDSLGELEHEFSQEKSFFCLLTKIKNQHIYLMKPTTLMNASGKAVKAFYEYYKMNSNDLIVIHDDLDIKLGEYKIQKGVGPKLHNGVESIEESIGTADFWRVRIGVDNRDPQNRIPGEEYVLQEFLDSEITSLQEVFPKIKAELTSMGIL